MKTKPEQQDVVRMPAASVQWAQTPSLASKGFLIVYFNCYFFPQAPGYGDVRLSLEAIPDTVNLEEPFHITCKITNCR